MEVAGDSDGLDNEFKQLEEVASNEVMEKTIETNIAHNRYNDIREYTFDLNLLVPRGLDTRSENTITNNKIWVKNSEIWHWGGGSFSHKKSCG